MICKKKITRPNDTTPYSIGDIINEDGSLVPIELEYPIFTNSPFLLLLHLISSNATSSPAIDIYFFSKSFAIAADNSPLALTQQQKDDYFLGKISATVWAADSVGKISSTKPDAPIALVPSGSLVDGKCYAVLVAAAAYTPEAQETITVKADVAN